MMLRALVSGKERFASPGTLFFSQHPDITDQLETGRQEGNRGGKENKRLGSISDTLISKIKKL